MGTKLRCTKADSGNTSASSFSSSRKRAVEEHSKKMTEDKLYNKIYKVMMMGKNNV